MKLLVITITLLATFCNSVSSKGYFTIVGSKLLKVNSPYNVAITSRNYDDQTTNVLQISIENSLKSWRSAQNLTLINGMSQALTFDMNGAPADNYKLRVKQDQFSSNIKLKMNTKNVTVFVQTDKGIYKPSDAVRFRVLVLNEKLQPLNETNAQVHVTDGAQNRVKQFDDIALTKGVYEDSFPLSDLPILGDWHLVVFINNTKAAEKVFEVAEYTLPSFEVTLEVNPHAHYDEQKLSATIIAKHTFGKIAKGNATITANVGSNTVSKSVEVNGKKSVDFDMKNDLRVYRSFRENTVKLVATFVEELTGRVQNATAKIQIHVTPHKIKIVKDSEKIKSGLPFTVKAIVQFHDKDTPVTDEKNAVVFTVKFYYEEITACQRHRTPYWSDYDEYERERFMAERYRWHSDRCSNTLSYSELKEVFPTNGIAEIKIEIPGNIFKLDVMAKYLNTEEWERGIKKTVTESNQYIKIKSTTEKPKLTEKIRINVLSTTEISELSYHLFIPKNVIGSETIRMPPTKSYDFEFSPTCEMIPKVKLVVFYITDDGEIISDSLAIEFENNLRNFINVSIPSNQVKPSESINISITSNANSFIGLLGVDQSVLVLKKSNDIEYSSVFEELKLYNKGVSKHGGARHKYTDFISSDGFMITNAKREYVLTKPYGYRPMHSVVATSAHYSPRAKGAYPQSAIDYQDSMRQEEEERISNFAPAAPPRDIEVRKNFPETWLFESLSFDLNQTNATISKKVPDTITSWIITGFSVDPTTGLGLTKEPSTLNVFQPFFVSINLPYSIKRGEIVSISVSVFNYMDVDQTAEVILFNEDSEFELIKAKSDDAVSHRETRATDNFTSKNLNVKSQNGSSTAFTIRPLKVGQIKIKVVAKSHLAGDGAERLLLVKPEGVTQYQNKAIFIDLRNSSTFETDININIPSNIVPDSTIVEASTTGDILGPSIENLDKLIKLPYGCGEQNMLNFVPNIVVLDYLTAVNKLTPEIKSKAKQFLETGYQRELTYKHDDGSYSVWGKSDEFGSTWLTAFVAKSFRQAVKYISIDEDIIDKALNFLSKTQSENGSFVEVGYIFQKNIQGGASSGIALTAYTLITFLENQDFVQTYKVTIDKALSYLSENYHNITDNYSLAIATYTMQLASHSLKNVLMSDLEANAITKNGMMYWMKNTSAESKLSTKFSAVDIETTAYALQAFLEAGRLVDSSKIMKWLVSQRNGNGGFVSTQDTVVGLQALSKTAARMHSTNTNMNILITHADNKSSALYINERNALVLQKHELPSSERDFKVTATGQGFSIVQISSQYNVDASHGKYAFNIDPVVMPTSNKNFLHLKVCTNYISSETTVKSNMAVMEVTFPSGLIFDTDFLSKLKSTKAVKKVEFKDRKTMVVVYFNELDERSVCVEFTASRIHNVAMLKPASVVVYDYYDNNRYGLTFYSLPSSSVCDVCDVDDDECLRECEEMINEV
ncbi:CD109 antigen [Pseudolycoriella hygida]|uniref:TEP1-F n=1 Tax=Pseudolycoriella hygida TaxID=35572 RepID=A0A9Q0N1L4_9DIPT|nr:CD109 antigen [Pseudolycoriella hygida]